MPLSCGFWLGGCDNLDMVAALMFLRFGFMGDDEGSDELGNGVLKCLSEIVAETGPLRVRVL